jgi:hypothetical protein
MAVKHHIFNVSIKDIFPHEHLVDLGKEKLKWIETINVTKT